MVYYMVKDMAKHYPPAYYRYRQEHATLSVLLSKTTKEALDKARGNKSYSEFIKSLFSQNGLFFELQEQKAQIQAESQKQKTEIQKLKAEISHEKKELETKRQKFQQEIADRYQDAYKKGKEEGYNEGKEEGNIQGSKAGFIAGKDEGHKLGYLQGEKAGIEKGKQQGRKFYLGFCIHCGELLFWDLNNPEDIKKLLEAFGTIKIAHEECNKKLPNIEYHGTPEFIPYWPETKKALVSSYRGYAEFLCQEYAWCTGSSVCPCQ